MNADKKAALMNEVESMIQRAAKKLCRSAGGSMDASDLAQIGREAAFKASESYDAEGGASFRTYCWHPVHNVMRRAAWASRSVAGKVSKCVGYDVSFSAPVDAHSDDDESSVGDLFASDGPSVEEQVSKGQLEAKVRAIVAKVRAEQSNGALFDDLLERLMNSYFADSGARMRSEISYADLAAKYGSSRQSINQRENRIRAALAEALAGVEA